ncbi:MAG TPA: hypothetical protein IGR64_08185 [Leptolyngbyaceae cyanobacterium M65_K2018_010]|nr:hypothetical protein [Leptolyngbyaceae cyanobacterium M65_K2018_010]
MADLPNLKPSRSPSPVLAESKQPQPKPTQVSFELVSASEQPARTGARSVTSFPTAGPRTPAPLLPKGKRPAFSRHRHDANPALALKVLQDIQMAVEAWHGELKETIQRIQALYLEGPIVDGWLEAIETTPQPGEAGPSDAAILRHGDPQTLSNYVERLCESWGSNGSPTTEPTTPLHTNPLATTRYRLCSLSSDGQMQCLLCPPEQVSTLGLAIGRHQKLRQLLDQKAYLEAKLKRAVEVLTGSRDTLGIAPACSSQPDQV